MNRQSRTSAHVASGANTLDAVPEGFRGRFRTDRLSRDLYADGAGIARCVPRAVAVPDDADDLSVLVAWARREGHALVPRGSGSGMAAGAVGPGIVVDVSRFATVGAVDRDARSIRVGCGAVRDDVDRVARSVGLRFPVDPSSGAFCTIGGMAATNAAGARTLRHGAMRTWVRGVHCVFDDGTQAWIRRGEPLPYQLPAVERLAQTLGIMKGHVAAAAVVHASVRKESSGYALGRAFEPGGHLLDVLIGSEGTLAFFTEVELALTEVAGSTATVLACFASLEAATEGAARARELGASACELLDRTFLEVAASGQATGIPPGTESVLLAEMEGDDAGVVSALITALAQAFREVGATELHTALDPDAEHALWALRHAASPILARLAPTLCSMQFIEDGCVPPDRLPAYVRGVREALADAAFPGVIFGHAGDAHVHVNPLVDVTRAGWRDRVRGVMDRVCELTGQLGGTLSGEHGDGRLRVSQLARVWDVEARAAFSNIKAAADPSGILNPGCKVPIAASGGVEAVSGNVVGDAVADAFGDASGDASGDTLGVLRHDPAAPPLDPRADALLRDIERDRRWHAFRLEAVRSDPI